MAEKSNLEKSRRSININIGESKEPDKVYEMFGRIIKANDSNIKSQQRTEADLTIEDKSSILHELYRQNPKLFLTRFGQWLCEEDLDCFTRFSEEYEVEYPLGQVRKGLAEKRSGKAVKNRRYEALVRLEKDSGYFTEHEMRLRSPLLYEQYVGQFMSEEERLERDEKQMNGSEVTLSSFIFQQIDRTWLVERQGLEQEREEECMEEEEDDEEEDEAEDGGRKEEDENTDQKLPKISDEEKLQYQQEFLRIMKQKFLDGLDEDFDYSKVDTNEDYDNLTIISQDAEDKYFDEDDDEDNNILICNINKESNEINSDSDDDYLSDKILQQCC